MALRTRLGIDVDVDSSGVGPGVDQTTGKLGKLGGVAAKAGKAVGLGLAVAGAAALKLGADSIESASRQQQAFGALETIYGKSSRQVKAWAADAADSVGLARSEYAELSSLVGSQLQNMGFEQEKSAKRSDKLIRLGSDLAATYGGSVADAVSAVSSLMKGEADPIERYGVSIKASDVSARLAAEGLGELTGKAQKQAQATALLSMLNEQTAKTTGAFARESNTLAGQQERLSAKFENLKATLGEKLLPVATRVVAWVSEKMLPGAQKLGNYLAREFGPAFRRIGDFIRERVIPAGIKLYEWFVEKIAPGIKRSVTPVVEALVEVWKRIVRVFDENSETIDRLRGNLATFVEFCANKVAPFLSNILVPAIKAIGRVAEGTIRTVLWLIEKIQAAIGWADKLLNRGTQLDSQGFVDTGSGYVAPQYQGGNSGGNPLIPGGGVAPKAIPVLPPESAGRGVVAEQKVSVDLSGFGFIGDENALASAITTMLSRYYARTGRPAFS